MRKVRRTALATGVPGQRDHRCHAVVCRADARQDAVVRAPPMPRRRPCGPCCARSIPSHPARHPHARRLRHATYPFIADRSGPRHRRRARLDLRPAAGLCGGVGRAHDGAEAGLRPARRPAQPAADGDDERRRHAEGHAVESPIAIYVGQRPLRLALHRRPELHLRRARAPTTTPPAWPPCSSSRASWPSASSTRRSSSWRSPARSRACSARRTSPSRPRPPGWTSRGCSPTTSSAARRATGRARSVHRAPVLRGRADERDARAGALRQSIGGENDGPSRQLARYVKEVGENSATGMHVRLICRRDRFLRGGDHIPFLQQGYPAARFTEPARELRPRAPGRARRERRAVRRPRSSSSTSATSRAWRASTRAALADLACAPATPKNAEDRHDPAHQRHDADLGPEPGARPRGLRDRLA